MLRGLIKLYTNVINHITDERERGSKNTSKIIEVNLVPKL